MTLVIDSNRATKKQTQYEPSVTYWLYSDDDPFRIPANVNEEKNCQQQTGLCFSNFLRAATIGKSRGKTPNRIAYKPHINRFGEHLTNSEIERWIGWCVEWKLLPSYIEVGHLKDKFVLKFDDISPSLIYVYLCNLRHYEEWPDVIRISLYLADELKVEPYLALAFAANIGCGTSVHNYLHFDEVWTYSAPTPPNPTVSLAHAVALKWYIINSTVYDTRSCYGSGDFSAPAFTCWPTIQKIVQQLPIIRVPGCDLDHPEVIAAMNSVDVVSAKEHMNKYVPSQKKAAA